MKSLILFALVSSASAFADIPLPAAPAEQILVTRLQQSGNMMPGPIGSGHSIQSTIDFQAMSGGCTKASDFDLVIEKNPDYSQKLTFVRNTPDTCEGVYQAKKLTVKTNQLTGQPISITNPILVEEHFVF